MRIVFLILPGLGEYKIARLAAEMRDGLLVEETRRRGPFFAFAS